MEALFFIIFLASRFVPGKFNQYGPDLVPIDTVKGRNISNPSLQSRIINPPEPSITNEKYPWLAQIRRKKFIKVAPGTLRRTRKAIEWQPSGGAIVSKYIIITCLHCVCTNPYARERNDVSKHYCLISDIENQNRQGENEIFYSIGKLHFDRKSAHFNPNIEVTLPRYDPPRYDSDKDTDWRLQNGVKTHWGSKNGDIALVVNKKGLGLDNTLRTVIPIRLPSPSSPTEESPLDCQDTTSNCKIPVTTAGNGDRRYLKAINKEKELKKNTKKERKIGRSCNTNAGLGSKAFYDNGKIKPKERAYYFECLDIQRHAKGAIEGCPKLDNVDMSFSASSDAIITEQPKGYKTAYKASVPKSQSNGDCEKYYKGAIQAIEEYNNENPGSSTMINVDSFIKKADRFVVLVNQRVFDELNLEPGFKWSAKKQKRQRLIRNVCYVKNKVGKYGVCRTKEPPYWGFCSRSCQDAPRVKGSKFYDYILYDELKATYYEVAPPESQFKKTGKPTKH